MGDPYLSSDESLILSTHYILIDGVSLDLMLTSRRLILIDNSVNPFHLRTIPLDTIITVVAGMDVKGDPIITLSHMDPSGTGAPHPMDFVFTRQKGEQRVKECNYWATTLSSLAIGARNGALSAGTLPYDPVKTIQPRMSATYMIETFSPRKPVMEAYPVKAEPVTTPVPLKSPGEDKKLAGINESAPLKNAEMVEPPDSSKLPPIKQEDKEMPDREEPVSPLQEITIEAVQSTAITEKEEPVSSNQTIAIEADQSTTITDAEEPASPKQTIAIEVDQSTAITEKEEPVSPLPAIATVTIENPAISDAAQVWAEAVLTVKTPLPLIPLDLASETIPSGENIDDKKVADADHISTTPEKPIAEINKDVSSGDAMIPQSPSNNEPVEPPTPIAVPVPAAISPPSSKIPKSASPTLQLAAIIVIILVVLGVAFIGPFNQLNSKETSPSVVVPVVTVQTTPIPNLIPADGVWVRIEYPGTFIGEVGNPELMHPVSGSGVRIYKILRSDHVVKASVQKQENSGDTLLIEIYNYGTMIKSSSTRAPMGSVDILIDPVTGLPPGMKRGDIP